MEEKVIGNWTVYHWFCNKVTTNNMGVNFFKDINGIRTHKM